MQPQDKSLRGMQTVLRATGLLKQIASLHPEGITLRELAEKEALDRATVYRLAGALIEANLVERDISKKYRLGPDAMQLGLAAMRGAPILDRCKPLMKRLARRTKDTVFLVIRNGDYGHCIHSEEGDYPVKALVLQVGGMRVLGIGSAGITLLAELPDKDINAIYERHYLEFESRSLSLSKLQQIISQTRKQGYADTSGLVTHDVGGVGVSFKVTDEYTVAISVAAIKSRMNADRRLWIADIIKDELKSFY